MSNNLQKEQHRGVFSFLPSLFFSQVNSNRNVNIPFKIRYNAYQPYNEESKYYEEMMATTIHIFGL